MKNNLLLQPLQNEGIEDKYSNNVIFRYLEFVNTPLANMSHRYSLSSGELFYHTIYSLDDLKGADYRERERIASLLWDDLVDHARRRKIPIDDIEVIHALMTITYGVYRCLLLDKQSKYTAASGLIVARLIEIDASFVHTLSLHFNRATTILGENKLREQLTDYMNGSQFISDELDSFLASVGTKVDLTADLPTKENLQKVFKYAYTLSNDFSNLIDFLRDERERASDSDWARHALAIKESGVLKTNTFTNRFTQWLSFFGEMFGRVVAYQEPNKLRRSKSASDISIYFPKHVG